MKTVSQSLLALAGLASLLLVGCAADDRAASVDGTEGAALTCGRTAPTASGTFVASGNESPDPTGTRNPIVAVSAEGHTLTFTAKNGETGVITLSDATASGSFSDPWGLGAVWLGPFEGGRPNPPTSTMKLSGGAGVNFPIELKGAEAATMNGSFMFIDPILGNPLYVVTVKASGNTISFSDSWGSTATITLSGVETCAD